MDINAITQLIGTFGFPIFCSIILFWYILKRDEDEVKRDLMHKEETESLRKTIEYNTLVMQRLIDKLEGGTVK